MNNNEILVNAARFLFLLSLQIFLLNNINFLGFINPYLYILFIIFYPLDGNKGLLIFLSFLLGLSIDIFSDTGGVHAAASVFIAYMRPNILKFAFGVSYEHNSIKIRKANLTERFAYFGSLVLMHHLMLFILEIFSFQHLSLILKSTVFSGIFTLFLIFISQLLFSTKKS